MLEQEIIRAKLAAAYLKGVIWPQDEGIHVSVYIILTANVLLDKVVLAVVVKDDVHLLSPWPADIRTKHNGVRRFSVHVFLIQGTGEQFDVAASTVDVLFVLDRQLHHQGLVLVGKGGEIRRSSVKFSILRGFQACKEKLASDSYRSREPHKYIPHSYMPKMTKFNGPVTICSDYRHRVR